MKEDKVIPYIKRITPKDLPIVRCPNCHKEHPLARLAARVTCVCNYVFDPRKEK